LRLVIVVDQRYRRAPDGSVWTRMPPDYRFFAQHLEVFEEVRVVARVADAEPVERALRADGPGVTFAAVPCYAGAGQFVRSAARVAGAIVGAVRAGDALLLRAPSHLANLVAGLHARTRFSVEALGDPWDLYAPGAVRTPLRAAYRRYFSGMLRAQCAKARHSAFVSRALRERYPAESAWTLLDLELDAAAFGVPRERRSVGPFSIVSVGGFDHPVKGHDTLIRAVARLGEGYTATIAGGGRMREELDALAKSLGVRVRWAGELPGAESVRQVLASADLFALASRSEGKPRALIEAMALGLPVVATRVGGIPELLPDSQLAPPDDPAAIAAAIRATIEDRARYASLSKLGIERAREFEAAPQRARRREFLQAVAHA